MPHALVFVFLILQSAFPSAASSGQVIPRTELECRPDIEGIGDSLMSSLTFYSGFESSPDATYASGDARAVNPTPDYAYSEGVAGRGLLISAEDSSDSPEYRSDGNIRDDEGSISFWFRSTTKQPGGANRWLFTSNSDSWRFYLYLKNDNFRFDYYLIKKLPGIDSGEWNHIVLAWDKKTITLFINGEVGNEKAIQKNWKKLWQSGKTFRLGSHSDTGYANGVFDEFSTWNSKLKQEDVRRIFTMGSCHYPLIDPSSRTVTTSEEEIVHTGAILKNGNFEAGAKNDLIIDVPVPMSPTFPSIATFTSHASMVGVEDRSGVDDSRAMYINVPSASATSGAYQQPNTGTARVQTMAFKLNAGNTYRVSVMLKAPWGSDLDIALSVDALKSLQKTPAYMSKKISLKKYSGRWIRLELGGKPHEAYDDLYRLKLFVRNKGRDEAKLLIDELDVVQVGNESDDELSVSIRTSAQANIYTNKLGNDLAIGVANNTDDPIRSKLNLKINDLWGSEVQREELDVSLAQGTNRDFDVPIGTTATGIYRAQVSDRSGMVLAETTFSILPPQDQLSEMALQVSYDDYFLSVAKRLGVRWNRIWDNGRATTLPYVSPVASGRYQWEYSDRIIEKSVESDMEVVGLLSWPRSKWSRNWTNNTRPHWLHSRWNPQDDKVLDYRLFYDETFQAIWLDYVSKVVERYRDSVDHWELLNEPYLDGSPEWVADVYRKTVPVIKAINPDAKIIGPVIHDKVNWNSELFETDILEYIDVFSYHGYRMNIKQLEKMHALSGSDGIKRPVFDTENSALASGRLFCESCEGLEFTGYMDPLESASRITKDLVRSLAAGTDLYFYYWMVRYDAYDMPGSFIDHVGNLTSSAVSFATVAWLLNGYEDRYECGGNAGFSCYVFADNDGRFISVIWPNGAGISAATAKPGNAAEYRSIMGAPVDIPSVNQYLSEGSVPVYMTTANREEMVKSLAAYGLSLGIKRP